MTGKFIAYYRVSTQKQGNSGLGLEAQRKAVTDYLNGGRWTLVAELTEVETGKRNDRPQLTRALALCRVHRATLIIAKLDRLARNVAFISNLMEAGVDFVCCDLPTANKLTIHVLAAVAEAEAEMISVRTKAALAAAKARGVVLGNPSHFTDKVAARGRELGRKVLQQQAAKRRTDVLPIIEDIKASGITTIRDIADELNARRIPAPRGGCWSHTQVFRLLRKPALQHV
jgi:DNA invertase Pin-like site-specific DNA recombinase